jgi:hypothetical protein
MMDFDKMNQQDLTGDIRSKINELPSNWWQSVTTSSTLIQLFKQHIIPLLITGNVNGTFQYTIYTGFFLKSSDGLVWLTAGHVVDELISLLSSSSFKPKDLIWLDGHPSKKAESVRLHRTNIPMKSWKNEGIDIGAIIPSLLDTGNLLANENIKPIDPLIWKNLKLARPEGYFAIGFPKSTCEYITKPISKNKILHSIQPNYVCLPLEETTPPPEFAEIPLWSDPEAFYGKILPYIDFPEFELDQAKGMSGGPIFSIERDPDGHIRYRLVGIIQSFARAQSIFRAELINRISEVVEKWLDEIIENKI